MSNTNTPATSAAPKKTDILKSILNAPSVTEQFQNALKENSGTFVASVIDLYGSDPYLQQCEPKAVVMECLKAAVLKLPINKSLGFAYIVPYKKQGVQQPQFQLGYKGYVQLAMRTGQYRTINADIVYEGELKSRDKLTGEIDFSGTRTGDKPVGYFAHIAMLNGFTKTLYMSKEQVTAHAKRYSKAYSNQNSPWTTNFDEMALKTTVRNLLSHYGFLSVEMMGAIDNDNADNDNADNDMDDRNNSIAASANTKPIDITDVNFEQVGASNDNQEGEQQGEANTAKPEFE